MERRIVNGFEDFEALTGQLLGITDYFTITQEQISLFARATHDHQWIHTDPERAALESPFKATIAHGYLTLSMLTYFWLQLMEVRNVKMIVNYGIENLKFNQPVVVNSRVRARMLLHSAVNLRGISKIKVDVVFEIEGNKKPAYECRVVFLYHFN